MTHPQSPTASLGEQRVFTTITSTTVRTVLLLAAGVCNAVVAVWLAVSPPATAYEGSIYAAYPASLWAVFLIGVAAAVLLVLRSAVDGGTDWLYGLAFLCSLYVLFHLLPVFRGWAMYGRGGADALTHVGVARTILETGSIPATDWYPVVHVLIAGLGAFGVPLGSITSVLSAFFTPLYIVSMYLLGRRLLGSRNAGLAVLICSVPLLYAEFSHSLHPAIFSFLLLPVVLAVFIGAYNSDRTLPYAVVLGLFGLTLLLFHPITTVYLVGILSVSFIVRAGYSWLTDLDLRYTGEAALVTGLTVGWFAWFLQFAQIQRFARRVLSSLPGSGSSGGGGGATGGSGAGSAGSAGGSETGSIAAEMFARVRGIDSIEKLVTGFLVNYGPQFVVALLGVAAIVVTIGWYWSTRQFTIEDSWLAAQFGTGVLVTLVGIFFYVVSSDPIRNARYMILFGTLLAGLLLYRSLAGQLPWPSLNGPTVRVVLVVLVLSTAGLSVMTSYNDNYHLTHAEETGTEWYYDFRGTEPVGVAADVSYKMREYTEAGDYGTAKLRAYGGDSSTLPRRFGYGTHDSVATAVDGYETYVVTKPYDTTVPKFLDPSVRAEYTAYYESDLQRLGTDRGADRVYANGGYTIWYVDPET